MQSIETPKKYVKRKNTASNLVNDQCRFCPSKFSIKYGKCGRPSWENLYKISGKAEYNDNTTLAELCRNLGFHLEKSPHFSERICKPCGRSLRRTHAFHQQLKQAIGREKQENEELDEAEGDSQCAVEQTDQQQRFKRSLPTTISPERKSPPKQRRSLSNNESISTAGARKCLPFGDNRSAVEDFCLSSLNVDDLTRSKTTQEKISTQVKVLLLYPNNDVEVTAKFSDESKTVIMNIVKKKWQTVANTIFKHPQIKQGLLKPLQKATEKEFTEYCKLKNSVLLAKSPKEIAEFSNEKLLVEMNDACPYWSASIKGASGVEFSSGNVATSFSSSTAAKINAVALANAAVARARNQKMSALAYRMSTILFHSGAKREDIDRLNKLGVCMSPDSTVDFQQQMGDSCKSKVLKWKFEIEQKKLALLFLEEVRNKLPNDADVVDLAKDNVDSYDNFNKASYEYCESLLQSMAKDDVLTTEALDAAINLLKTEPLPEYK